MNISLKKTSFLSYSIVISHGVTVKYFISAIYFDMFCLYDDMMTDGFRSAENQS